MLSKYSDIYHPLQSYEFQTFQETDITVFKDVFAGIKNIIDQNKTMILSLRYLSSALYLSFFEPRFVLFTSILESLFTTDNIEVSHKISERVAFFLEKEPDKRKDIFIKMKKIYSIRSSIVHGLGLSKKSMDGVNDLTLDLEFITQRILKKIITTSELIDVFSSDREKKEKYLSGLLFVE